MTYLLDRRKRLVLLAGKRQAMPAPLANLASWRLKSEGTGGLVYGNGQGNKSEVEGSGPKTMKLSVDGFVRVEGSREVFYQRKKCRGGKVS